MTVLHVAGASGGMQEGGGRVPELEIVKKNYSSRAVTLSENSEFLL